MRATLTALAIVASFTVGCGDSDDTTGTDPSDSDDAGVDTDAPEPTDASGSSGGLNTAVITVGGESYEFEWEAGSIQKCDTDFFGGFWAIAATTSDQSSFQAVLRPEDDPVDDVSSVEVSGGDGTGVHWTADPEETIGQTVENWPAQVDSFEINGNTASGTATFVGDFTFGEEPEGTPGTFEITCAS